MDIRHKGNKSHRFKNNPLEKLFADAWEEQNATENERPSTLAWLMSTDKLNQFAGAITQRDATVAASIIQWLGSPVGGSFLANVLSRPEAADFRARLAYEVRNNRDA